MSSDIRTNNIVSKPIKINPWNTNALKYTLDDACKKYFKETLNYTEDFMIVNRRLYISCIACLFSLYALVYDWLYPFPKSRSILIVCVISYFILISILTFYMKFIERGRFFSGKLIEKTGLTAGDRCQISSQIKKYDDIYTLTLEYNEGIDKSKRSLEYLIKSVGNYFDKNGVLCYDRFAGDLKQFYNQAQLYTRKVK